MNWSYYNTGPNTGLFNMNLDIYFAKHLKESEHILRLYRWEPYCISLGANQSEHILDPHKLEAEGIDFIKRPTGGRAILHSEELTYSVIIPVSRGDSAREIYHTINCALRAGLILFDRKLENLQLESDQPDFRRHYKNVNSTACFAVAAKSEIKYEGKKLVGSAQRKIGSVILQHGSILCGRHHLRIVNFLNVKEEEKYNLIEEMKQNTTDLWSVSGFNNEYDHLADCIADGFENFFGIKLERFRFEENPASLLF